jgi:hypothetical protein
MSQRGFFTFALVAGATLLAGVPDVYAVAEKPREKKAVRSTEKAVAASTSAGNEENASKGNEENPPPSLEELTEVKPEAFSIPKLPPVNPALPHRGEVAYFGPFYFSEFLDFDPVQDGLSNFQLRSTVRGFSAGLLLGSQFEHFNLGMNVGLMGGYNHLEERTGSPMAYSSSGLLLGAALKPHALARVWRKVEFGLVVPFIVRYASYGSSIEGTIISSHLRALISAGVRLGFDLGRTRVISDFALIDRHNKYLSFEFQFEL